MAKQGGSGTLGVVDPQEHARRIVDGLVGAGVEVVASLPDLKVVEVIRALERESRLRHVPLCREEEGVGICAGAFLAGKRGALLMQNGGFLNACNGLTTTALQFEIPMLLLIYYAGDRGDRGFATVGAMTEPVLRALGIRYEVLRDVSEAPRMLREYQILAEDSKRPVALLLTQDVLGVRGVRLSYEGGPLPLGRSSRGADELVRAVAPQQSPEERPTRYQCLEALADALGDALTVSAGGTYREWEALRPSAGNLRGRTLGLVSSMGLGLAVSLPSRRVVVLDGDGALLMNLCGLPTIAWQSPANLLHVVFVNGCYEASGSTATATAAGTDLVAMAQAAGYRHWAWVATPEELRREAGRAMEANQLTFIGVKVRPGRESGLAESSMDEIELKYRFMRHVEAMEGVPVLRGSF
ncbi:MAG: hypothetical protein HYY05_05905 [Chloroflexi bacterium]|nr:hypothetical protein [Chloroflexota bacterium]